MKSVQQIEGNPLVRCGCGRIVNADMMRVLGDGYGWMRATRLYSETESLTRERSSSDRTTPRSQ